MSKTIPNEALAVLGRGEVQGQVYFLPAGQLPRPLYEAVNKALEALGGKWNRKLRGHLFADVPDLESALMEVLNTGQVTDQRQALGFFETPAPLAVQLVLRAEIHPDMRVLEPSAGRGAIAKEVCALHPDARLLCVEIDAPRAAYLRQQLFEVQPGDFLSLDPPALGYDRVVMNPPFAKSADVQHVRHAWEWLRPGGRLVSVMGAGVLFRETKAHASFREFAEAHGTLEPLPEGSFRESGTGVNTCVCTVQKPG